MNDFLQFIGCVVIVLFVLWTLVSNIMTNCNINASHDNKVTTDKLERLEIRLTKRVERLEDEARNYLTR